MLALQHAFNRSHRNDAAIGECGDAIADRVKTVEIVGNYEDGQAQSLLQRPDQPVELSRCDRIEPRGRLVEKNNLRVERERASAARFVIPPDSSAGNLSPSSALNPTISSLAVASS